MIMAFEVKIEFFQSDQGLPVLEITPDWWNYRELKKEYKFSRDPKKDPEAFILDASIEELIDIHLFQYKNLTKGVFGFPDWQKIILPKKEQIEQIIAAPEAYPKIRVKIYEWESGWE
jgi:hypothetical protein